MYFYKSFKKSKYYRLSIRELFKISIQINIIGIYLLYSNHKHHSNYIVEILNLIHLKLIILNQNGGKQYGISYIYMDSRPSLINSKLLKYYNKNNKKQMHYLIFWKNSLFTIIHPLKNQKINKFYLIFCTCLIVMVIIMVIVIKIN